MGAGPRRRFLNHTYSLLNIGSWRGTYTKMFSFDRASLLSSGSPDTVTLRNACLWCRSRDAASQGKKSNLEVRQSQSNTQSTDQMEARGVESDCQTHSGPVEHGRGQACPSRAQVSHEQLSLHFNSNKALLYLLDVKEINRMWLLWVKT